MLLFIIRRDIMKKCLSLSLIILVLISSTSFSLYYSPSYYDGIAYNWTYSATYTTNYNCLAYALGYTDRWVWPFSEAFPPTLSNTTTYLLGLGYTQGGSSIVAYGTSLTNITHFSKITNFNACEAKWGSLERFTHVGLDPYKPTPYGPKRSTYGN